MTSNKNFIQSLPKKNRLSLRKFTGRVNHLCDFFGDFELWSYEISAKRPEKTTCFPPHYMAEPMCLSLRELAASLKLPGSPLYLGPFFEVEVGLR